MASRLTRSERRRRSETARFAGHQDGLGLNVGSGSFVLHQQRLVCLDINRALRPTVVASAIHLPFRSSIFDYVLCFEVLEHIDDRQALREIGRVLKPGGRFVGSFPNLLRHLVGVRYLLRTRWSYMDPGHKREYVLEQVVRCMAEAGLEIRRLGWIKSSRLLLNSLAEYFLVEATSRAP